MRTNVVIDDILMDKALKAGKFHTKRAAIEAGLRLIAKENSIKRIKELKGNIHWDGDLDAMRKNRNGRY